MARHTKTLLFPLCGPGGLGCEVVHDPGNARDLLDLGHHLHHHLQRGKSAGAIPGAPEAVSDLL